MGGEALPITGVRQVKLPVTDLARSAAFYRRLLDLRPGLEFVEQGRLRGVVLGHASGFQVGLREREACASRPDLAGHDVVAFALPGREDVGSLLERCAELGIAHDPPHDRGEMGIAVDVRDPDGTVLRFLAGQPTVVETGFIGVAFDEDGAMSTYETPRLPAD